MRICPRCHARYADESRFCPRDGAPLPELAGDPRIGTVLYGQFTLEAVCGKGAMGTVYRARQASMDRLVAVKILRQELLRDRAVVKRFQREARAVAKIQHPNIVTVFLVGETDDGVPFLVMEYVEGEALADLLDRERILPAPRALRIARQVTSALAEAHALGIVHRDLKPANLVVSQKRRAPDFTYVLDFGIAKILHAGDGREGESHLSRTGTIFGTPHYIAPEQAGGFEVDHRADLYSLGVILYRMLTGKLPFEGSGVAVLLAHMQKPVPRPREVRPDLEPELEALILRALAKDPRERFQSAEEMGDAIDAIRPTAGSMSAPLPSVVKDPPSAPGTPTVGSVGKRETPPSGGTIARTPPAPANLVPSGPSKAMPWTMRGLGGPAPAAAEEQVIASVPVTPLPAPMPDSTPVPYGVPPEESAPGRVPRAREAMTLAAQPTPIPPPPAPTTPSVETPPVVAQRYTSDVEPLPDAALSSTGYVYRQPGRGRVIALGFAVVLAGLGVAAAWIWYSEGKDVSAAVPAPPSEPSPGPSEAPSTTPDAASTAEPGPGPAPTPTPTPEPPVTTPIAKRRLTLGEGGYSARVSMPARIVAGEGAEIVIEAFDRQGQPLAGSELTLTIENPAGVEVMLALPRTDAPGRFAMRRAFTPGGRHHVHIFPAGRAAGQHMYFDVNVEGAGPKKAVKLKHRDRPLTGHRHVEKQERDEKPPPSPPPKDDQGGEFAKPPPPKEDPYHPIDPGDKPPNDVGVDDLE